MPVGNAIAVSIVGGNAHTICVGTVSGGLRRDLAFASPHLHTEALYPTTLQEHCRNFHMLRPDVLAHTFAEPIDPGGTCDPTVEIVKDTAVKVISIVRTFTERCTYKWTAHMSGNSTLSIRWPL